MGPLAALGGPGGPGEVPGLSEFFGGDDPSAAPAIGDAAGTTSRTGLYVINPAWPGGTRAVRI